MACTVKQVAALSGVSVRTLHFYDETGLLKPAYVGTNGYRFYEEPQLLTLQQVQSIIRRHYGWLKRFWTPTRQSYTGHSQLIVDSELRKAYEAYHSQLPEFAASAMKVFAQKELS